MIYLVPDTNYALRYRIFDEVRAADLRLADEITWLIPYTVFHELEQKKTHSDAALQQRARKLSPIVNAAAEGRHKNIVVFIPTALFDYSRTNLNSQHADHRILGELLLFKAKEAHADVRLLSGDGSLRVVARAHGIVAIAADDALILPKEDSSSKRIRQLEDRVRELESASPELDVRPANDGAEIHAIVAPVLSDHLISAVVEISGKEEPDLTVHIALLAIAGSEKNPDYQTHLDQLRQALPGYLEHAHRALYRTVSVDLVLANGGKRAAENIDVELVFPYAVSTEKPKMPLRPPEPSRYRSRYQGLLQSGAMSRWYRETPPNLAAFLSRPEPTYSRGPSVKQQADGTYAVTLRREGLRQETAWPIPTLFVLLPDDAPEAFLVKATFSARNGVGIQRRDVLVRVETVNQSLHGINPSKDPVRRLRIRELLALGPELIEVSESSSVGEELGDEP